MLVPRGAVRTMVLVTLEVIGCSWSSVLQGVIWACFHGGCLFGAAPTEAAALDLLRQSWLRPVPSEVAPLCLFLWRSLPDLAEVADSGLFP